MNKNSILAKLHTMTIEEKLTLLSDTDKAYIQNYLNRTESRPQEQDTQVRAAGKKPEKMRKEFFGNV
jgi:hypothetical protein